MLTAQLSKVKATTKQVPAKAKLVADSKWADAQEEIDLFWKGGVDTADLTEEEAAMLPRPSWWTPENEERKSAEIRRLKSLGKTRGALFIARRIMEGDEPDLRALALQWRIKKEIKEALHLYPEEDISQMGLQAVKLQSIGCKNAQDVHRFVELYREVFNPQRPWGSCYQPSQGKVLAIATCPNFNKLPIWVKAQMVKSEQYIHTDDRVGNIWRYFECAKAWKWTPELPKNIAEKVGKMSLRARMRAKAAFNRLGFDEVYALEGKDEHIPRYVAKNTFYQLLDYVCSLPLLDFFESLDRREYSKFQKQMILECEWGLPFNFLKGAWHGDLTRRQVTHLAGKYGSPKIACHSLLGVKGKGTLKAFANSNANARSWASTLAYGEPNTVQKFLELGEDAHLYEPEVVEMMRSWNTKTQLRMIQKTTYRYRDHDYSVTKDMVRDTGYFWKNVQELPELGRIRCWFSLHETLHQQYIQERPDVPVNTPQEWMNLDGLSAVDGTWELEFPTRSATLKWWGEKLENCIGGYDEAVNSGRSVVFAVKEGGNLTHAVEVSGGEVEQFYAARNSSPNPRIKKEVEASLKQGGFIS